MGRGRELHRLAERCADAAAGRGGIVLLTGPAGVGKSRTAEECVAGLAAEDARVVRGRCVEQPGAPAFWPWRRALRELLDGVEREGLATLVDGDAGAVRELLPELADRLGAPTGAAGRDPQEARFSILDGLAGVLLRAAVRTPIVVLIDDLHWADPSSVELLAYLAPELARSRLLVIATHREPSGRAGAAVLARLVRASEVLRLQGLDAEESGLLVTQLAGASVDASLRDAVHARTGGNPFFIDELVRLLRAEDRLGATGEEAALPLPEGVRDVIRGHLDALGAAERELLVLAAVAGHAFDLGVLAKAGERTPEATLALLGSAVELGLVRQPQGGVARFQFAHALIPETLYGDLAPVARAALHRRVGLALEEIHEGAGDPPLAALAHHFFLAAPLGDATRAVRFAERAGLRALEGAAHREAAAHLRNAIEAQAFAPDDATRLRLLLALGQAESNAGAEEPAREAFERAARLAESRGDAAAIAHAAIGYARVTLPIGVVNPVSVALLEQADRALGDGDSVLRVVVLGQLSSALHFANDPARCDALSAASVAMARRIEDDAALVTALLMRHFSRWGPDTEPAELLSLADEALGRADGRSEPRIAVQLQRWRTLDLLELRRVQDAEEEIGRMQLRCQEWRLPSYAFHARVLRAAIELATGRLAPAAEPVVQGHGGRFGGPLSNLAQTFEIHAFLLRLQCGGVEASEPILRFARQLPGAAPIWRAGLVLLLLELGREDDARTEMAALFRHELRDVPRDGTRIPCLALAAEAAWMLGDARAAGLVEPLLAPHRERGVVLAVGAGYYGVASRSMGLLALACGRPDAAVSELEHALACNLASGALTFAAYARDELAQALAQRDGPGDAARAADLEREAHADAARLGIERLRRRIDARASHAADRRAAGDVPRAIPAGGVAAEPKALLRQEGDHWRVALDGRSFPLRDTKGLVYLRELLRNPGREIHAIDLAAEGAPGAPAGDARSLREAGLAADGGASDAGPLLDARAREAYRERVRDLREELADAEEAGHPERAERAREELEFVARELARGVGLGGRERRAGSAAERARLNVTRAIASALRRIAEQDPALGEHLTATIRTGIFCSYTPDPRRPLGWDLA